MPLKMRLPQPLFILCCASLCVMSNVAGDDYPELERLVTTMNKRPIQTFVFIYEVSNKLVLEHLSPDISTQTGEGDTINCVDIDKQPALNHPLLKNHKVQENSNLYSTRFHLGNSSNAKFVQFGLRKPCPTGTVPIPQVTKEDLRRARTMPRISSIQAEGLKDASTSQHLVLLKDDMVANVKYGGFGSTSVFNLTVAPDQCSTHYMVIESDPPGHVSAIAAGWTVCPLLYGDTLTRLFTYWTGNGRDGCYNVLCPSFVQVDSQVTTNYPVSPTSVYGGEIYEVPIQIQQDRTFGNWWLRVSKPPISVGYWPKELFLNLRHGSLHVAWGGDGFTGRNGFCPPMGSGHKPDGDHDFVRATYFRRLNWVRVDGAVLPPSKNTKEVVDKSNVYALRNFRYKKGTWGYTFSFGGPADYCRG